MIHLTYLQVLVGSDFIQPPGEKPDKLYNDQAFSQVVRKIGFIGQQGRRFMARNVRRCQVEQLPGSSGGPTPATVLLGVLAM